ncbi:MAG: aminoacyl-tRNA hydrolase [Lachnospiraceae bacterium]|nr:aminoacyl-tRNA hydrolase [Lachnospiraceae bacterium]
MYVIAGLGNPDKQYENTRHNIGFDAIDALAEKYNIDISIRKHRAYCGKGMINGNKVVLVKPQTYMNLSGESLRSVVDYYKIDPESELLVLFDDISLDVGQLRIRKKGSAGGHNGIKNIIANLNTQNFARIKIGVGEKPKKMDLVDYVLGHFTKSERVLMDEAIEHAIRAAGMIVEGEMDSAMNIYNQKNKEISQQRKEEA